MTLLMEYHKNRTVISLVTLLGLTILYRSGGITLNHVTSWNIHLTSTNYLNQDYNTHHKFSDGSTEQCAHFCEKDFTVLRSRNGQHSIAITINSSLKCAVCHFNRELAMIRKQKLLRIGQFDNISHSQAPSHIAKTTAQMLSTDSDKYFQIIDNFPQVTTVFLYWPPLKNKQWHLARLPVKSYHEADFPPKGLCKYATMSKECRHPRSLNSSSVHSLPDTPYKVRGDIGTIEGEVPGYPDVPLYMHIVHNAYVDADGGIHTGALDLVPFMCDHKLKANREGHRTASFLPEVFTISQYWGSAYFHSLVETLPRIAAYVDFLKRNPQIYIHVGAERLQQNLEVLGLNPKRAVFGYIRAKIIYAPQGGGCGRLYPIAGQLLFDQHQSYIHSAFPNLQKSVSIVLIKRTKTRWLAQHDEIANMLNDIAKETEMSVKIFSDDPPPNFAETLEIFQKAKIVIAPHGAGLANVLYSPSGTVVVEIMCNPRFIGCYWQMSQTLGHRYIGLLSTVKQSCGPLYVDLDYLKYLVEYALK